MRRNGDLPDFDPPARIRLLLQNERLRDLGFSGNHARNMPMQPVFDIDAIEKSDEPAAEKLGLKMDEFREELVHIEVIWKAGRNKRLIEYAIELNHDDDIQQMVDDMFSNAQYRCNERKKPMNIDFRGLRGDRTRIFTVNARFMPEDHRHETETSGDAIGDIIRIQNESLASVHSRNNELMERATSMLREMTAVMKQGVDNRQVEVDLARLRLEEARSSRQDELELERIRRAERMTTSAIKDLGPLAIRLAASLLTKKGPTQEMDGPQDQLISTTIKSVISDLTDDQREKLSSAFGEKPWDLICSCIDKPDADAKHILSAVKEEIAKANKNPQTLVLEIADIIGVEKVQKVLEVLAYAA
jgi:hypothetical protein